MIVNQDTLLAYAPIKDMLALKTSFRGASHGLSEAGYDIRLKQSLYFIPKGMVGYPPRFDENLLCWGIRRKRVKNNSIYLTDGDTVTRTKRTRFTLASTLEEFQMPASLMGVVHDKSTWARQGVSVYNTVIEPGWKGFLTLEICFKGNEPVIIPSGTGIAQVIFHQLTNPTAYNGKYQNQENQPVPARSS